MSRRRNLLRVMAVLAALAVLGTVYTRLSAQSTVNSDGANEALQGLAFWHGNLLLHGWWLAQDTFYLADAPLYGLLARIEGLGPWVVHQGAGLVYAAAVLAAALLARRGAPFALAVLALPAPLLLQGQMHLLGVAYVFVALLLVETRPGRWWSLAVAAVLVAAAMGSDPLMTLLFAPALAIASFLRPERRRDLLPLAVGAAILGTAFPYVAVHLGGFALARPVHTGLANPSEMARHLRLLVRGLMLLFHADVVAAPADPVSWLRLPAAAAAVAAVLLAARRLTSRAADQLVTQVLVLACAIDVCAFLVTTQAVDLDSSRFLGPFALAGAVLAGRELRPRLSDRRLLAAAVGVGLAMTSALPLQLSRAAPPSPTAGLERWLEARGLTSGLGSYWEAGIVTLDTGGRVTVRCVDGGSRAAPDRWFQDSAWFVPGAALAANFVVFSPGERTANIDEARAVADFGPPAEIHRVGPYVVLIYSHDLLRDLQT